MIPFRTLSLILVVLAAPAVALPDPQPNPQPDLLPVMVAAPQVRPVARPFDLYLAAIAATLACLDSQTGRRRC